MDHSFIGVVLQSLVGPIPLTLAIVVGYGFLLNRIRDHANSRDNVDAIFHVVLGLIMVPLLMELVFLWSFALDLSFAWGACVWCGALAIAHHCASFVTGLRRARSLLAEPRRLAA